ncbi:S-layer homology domain-containing protein [Paenibacillus thalictri]|nr:S-layer homology domain-containing protein [Paenibacillus thalictri]
MLMMNTVWLAIPAAAGAINSMSGAGTELSPYLVTNAAQLNEVRNVLGAYYKQTADIVLSGNWSPIGDSSNEFIGQYDGNGKHISGLTVVSQENGGLFGIVGAGGEIRNLTLDSPSVTGPTNGSLGSLVGQLEGKVSDVVVNGGSVSGGALVGGLAGMANTGSEIKRVRSSANVQGAGNYAGGIVSRLLGTLENSSASGTVNGVNYSGGLVGDGYNATITDSYATGNVTSTGSFTGGLIGNTEGGQVRRSYATGNVIGDMYAGGLTGMASNGTIADSYATGSVSASSTQGGLIGYFVAMNVSNTYATGAVGAVGAQDGGGLIGTVHTQGPITSSYYDKQTTGRSDTGQGLGKETEEMGKEATYVGWNFDTLWGLDERDGYPKLIAYDTMPPVVKSASVEDATPNQVIVTFVERMALDNLAVGRFAVKVDGQNATVAGGSLSTSGRVLTLTLSAPVLKGQTVTLDYEAGSNQITDLKGNPLEVFSDQAVANNVLVLSVTVTAAASATEVIYGRTVTVTATVYSTNGGTPTGTVTFKAGSFVVGTASVNAAGIASLTTAQLPEPQTSATEQITAEYSGDALFNNGSSAAVPLIIYKTIGSTVTRTTSVSSSVYGQEISFVFQMTPQTMLGGAPTGTVEFLEGSAKLSETTLALMQNNIYGATWKTAGLAVGTHTITANYLGDTASGGLHPADGGNFPAVTVNKAQVNVTLTASVSALVYGEQTQLTAAIAAKSPGSGVPDGTVTFQNAADSSSIGDPVPLVNGQASSQPLSGLALGTHSFNAVFNGSASYLTGISASPLDITVVRSDNAKLSSLALTDGSGQPVALTPEFDAAKLGYSATVPYDVTGVRTTAVTQNLYASLMLNGAAAVSGQQGSLQPLSIGNNTVTAEVYAHNGDKLTYQVTIERLGTKPDAPTGISVTAGNGQATVSFTPPANNGGTAITSYAVTSSPGGITTTGSGSPITVSGLENGTAYTFTVTATNAAGTSAASDASAAVTPVGQPGAPVGVSVVAGIGQATVSFTPPTNNGGLAITSYTVTSNPGGFTATGSGSPITVSGLANGTAYTFTVTATNAEGTSAASDASAPVTPRFPSNTSSSSGTAAPSGVTITVNVENGGNNDGSVVSTAVINRTTDAAGRKTDTVNFTSEQATKVVDQLTSAGSHSARLVIPDPQDEVSVLNVNLPKVSADKLADANIGMEIAASHAKIDVPSGSLQGLQDDVYFRVVPVKEADERKAIEQRAKNNVQSSFMIGGADLQIIGRPLTIDTNLQSRPVTLVLPLGDHKLSEAQLKDLGVFIEHSDGTKEWVKGEIVAYDESGILGIRFGVTHFSTFTVVYKVEASSSVHKAYMTGYPDGTFGPDKNISRAELASLLARVYDREATQSAIAFTDVAASHWAKEAIEKAAKMGLMQGYPDASFKPEQPVTRAEMAAIAARLSAAGSAANAAAGGFSDTTGHWASASIDNVRTAGIIGGYPDGTYRPERTLTRAEAVTIVNKLLGRGTLSGAKPAWSDVPENHWAFASIQEATVDHTYKPKPDGSEQWVSTP